MTSEEYIGKNAPRWYIVLFRLYMACWFIFLGVSGVMEWQAKKSVFADRFDKFAASDTQVGWFRSYLNTAIEPIKNNIVFAILLLAAPLLLGLSLLLGLLTRLSTFLGMLLVLNYLLIKFHHALDLGGAYEFQLMLHVMEIAGLAVLFFAAAGRTFGLDGIFWRNRVRAKFEPPVPEEMKAAAAQTPAARATPIPLAEQKPDRIEHSIGHFTAPEAPKKPPAAPGPAKEEPQTKTEPGQEGPPQK